MCAAVGSNELLSAFFLCRIEQRRLSGGGGRLRLPRARKRCARGGFRLRIEPITFRERRCCELAERRRLGYRFVFDEAAALGAQT